MLGLTISRIKQAQTGLGTNTLDLARLGVALREAQVALQAPCGHGEMGCCGRETVLPLFWVSCADSGNIFVAGVGWQLPCIPQSLCINRYPWQSPLLVSSGGDSTPSGPLPSSHPRTPTHPELGPLIPLPHFHPAPGHRTPLGTDVVPHC